MSVAAYSGIFWLSDRDWQEDIETVIYRQYELQAFDPSLIETRKNCIFMTIDKRRNAFHGMNE